MSKVLITGATGYIGGHLARSRRAAGDSVRCLIRSSSRGDRLDGLDVELCHGDVTDAPSLAKAASGCDVVYHLAGLTATLSRSALYDVNAVGTHRVAQACARQTTPPLLVVLSSLAAAGTSPTWKAQSEADLARPVSHYGRSKRAGELAAASWAAQIPVSIVRPGIVFGQGNREMLPMFRSIQRFGLHAIPGFTPRRLSLIHHEDLISILQRVVEWGERVSQNGRGAAGEERPLTGNASGCYFASAPEFLTYQQLGRTIARSLDKRCTLMLQLAEPLVWFSALGSELAARTTGRASTFNVDKIRDVFAGQWTNSVERIENELGFSFPVSLQQRFNETAEWYRNRNWL